MQEKPGAENVSHVLHIMCDTITLGHILSKVCVHKHNMEKTAESPSTLHKGPEREVGLSVEQTKVQTHLLGNVCGASVRGDNGCVLWGKDGSYRHSKPHL